MVQRETARHDEQRYQAEIMVDAMAHTSMHLGRQQTFENSVLRIKREGALSYFFMCFRLGAEPDCGVKGTMVQVPCVVEDYAEMLKIFGIIYCQLGLPAIDSQYIRLPRGLSGIFLPAGSGSAAWA